MPLKYTPSHFRKTIYPNLSTMLIKRTSFFKGIASEDATFKNLGRLIILKLLTLSSKLSDFFTFS